MEVTEAYIIDAGWFFFAAWSLVLVAFGAIAFGRELLTLSKRSGNRPR